MRVVFDIVLVLTALPAAYLCLLAVAGIRTPSTKPSRQPRHRFAVVVPAHDEEAVIGRTVSALRKLDYPAELFDIHVVADHCSDRTAALSRAGGAVVHERNVDPRGSKGAALRWLFSRIFIESAATGDDTPYDAVVLFDADTEVSPDFLRLMDARLTRGDQVVQGQHRISNPDAGWFAALTWAMFMIDNRFQNLGRSNLGWSAKNMGDCICFRTDLLRRLTLGESLAEDYAFRQNLLLNGVTIRYEPAAIGFGEAAPDLKTAYAQRLRWLRGAYDSSRRNAGKMLREAISRRDLALLDGTVQSVLPSYSSLTLAVVVSSFSDALLAFAGDYPFRVEWLVLTLLLIGYPLFGLALERAPRQAYFAIVYGPLFISWRTWLALVARFGKRHIGWVRTSHGGRGDGGADVR